MRRAILQLAFVALAACSQSEPSPTETASAAPAGTATPTAPAPQVAVVPDRFQGIWDAETGTCDPASDLRVEISERGITFYESHGAVTAIAVESPDIVIVDLAMEGEGEKWTLRRRFTLSNGDRTLTPAAVDESEQFEPMPLKRCA